MRQSRSAGDRRLARRVTLLTALIWLIGALPASAAVDAHSWPDRSVATRTTRPAAITPDALPLLPPPAPEVRLPAPAAVVPPLAPDIPAFGASSSLPLPRPIPTR
jgi:hypothetical protein